MQTEQEAAAEIMYLFRYFYKNEWMPGNIFNGKSRIWVKVFNDLVKKGFIERKKTEFGYQYKWAAAFPDNY